MKFWRILPGESNVKSTTVGKFICENYIAIGWNRVRDLANVYEEDLRAVCREDLVGWDEESILNAVNELKKFRYQMREGDIVVVSDPEYIYAVGKVTSDYCKIEEPIGMPEEICRLGFYSFYHRRKVEWMKVMKLSQLTISSHISFFGLPEDFFMPTPWLLEISQYEWVNVAAILLMSV